MSWETTLRRAFGVLTLTRLGLCGGAGALGSEFLLWLGTLVPPSPLNSSALACPVPTDPLELALWRVTTEGGRADHSCGNVFTGYLRTPRAPGQPDAFDSTAKQIRQARSEVLLTTMEWHAGGAVPAGPSPSPCGTCIGKYGLIPSPTRRA